MGVLDNAKGPNEVEHVIFKRKVLQVGYDCISGFVHIPQYLPCCLGEFQPEVDANRYVSFVGATDEPSSPPAADVQHELVTMHGGHWQFENRVVFEFAN